MTIPIPRECKGTKYKVQGAEGQGAMDRVQWTGCKGAGWNEMTIPIPREYKGTKFRVQGAMDSVQWTVCKGFTITVILTPNVILNSFQDLMTKVTYWL